jgi:hypothetical protein
MIWLSTTPAAALKPERILLVTTPQAMGDTDV